MSVPADDDELHVTPYLPLQGGFSDGYFLYADDTFDINKQGVVSLRKDVTLDREAVDSYVLQVHAALRLFLQRFSTYCSMTSL